MGARYFVVLEPRSALLYGIENVGIEFRVIEYHTGNAFNVHVLTCDAAGVF